MDELSREDLERNLSDARHTISNPLTIISGNVQLLLQLAEMGELDDEVVQSLEDICEATDELQRLVNEVYTADNMLRPE